jgi:hypothetical protein
VASKLDLSHSDHPDCAPGRPRNLTPKRESGKFILDNDKDLRRQTRERISRLEWVFARRRHTDYRGRWGFGDGTEVDASISQCLRSDGPPSRPREDCSSATSRARRATAPRRGVGGSNRQAPGRTVRSSAAVNVPAAISRASRGQTRGRQTGNSLRCRVFPARAVCRT